MRQEAYFCTVKELDELGKNNIPRQLISHTHLIYSSPATLAFNSPGAEGFGAPVFQSVHPHPHQL